MSVYVSSNSLVWTGGATQKIRLEVWINGVASGCFLDINSLTATGWHDVSTVVAAVATPADCTFVMTLFDARTGTGGSVLVSGELGLTGTLRIM
jgi:hypothetical protein